MNSSGINDTHTSCAVLHCRIQSRAAANCAVAGSSVSLVYCNTSSVAAPQSRTVGGCTQPCHWMFARLALGSSHSVLPICTSPRGPSPRSCRAMCAPYNATACVLPAASAPLCTRIHTCLRMRQSPQLRSEVSAARLSAQELACYFASRQLLLCAENARRSTVRDAENLGPLEISGMTHRSSKSQKPLVPIALQHANGDGRVEQHSDDFAGEQQLGERLLKVKV